MNNTISLCTIMPESEIKDSFNENLLEPFNPDGISIDPKAVL